VSCDRLAGDSGLAVRRSQGGTTVPSRHGPTFAAARFPLGKLVARQRRLQAGDRVNADEVPLSHVTRVILNLSYRNR
jgi:hypothetical protein